MVRFSFGSVIIMLRVPGAGAGPPQVLHPVTSGECPASGSFSSEMRKPSGQGRRGPAEKCWRPVLLVFLGRQKQLHDEINRALDADPRHEKVCDAG